MTRRPFGLSKKAWQKLQSRKKYGLKDFKTYKIYTDYSGRLLEIQPRKA